MIIEDDRDTVALFQRVLDTAGFITEIVLHGEKALERLDRTTPDIILLDLNLTGVPGIEILKKIRANRRLKDTPVIVVTGYPQMAAELQSESDLILHKPVGLELLAKLISRFHPIDTTVLKNPPYDQVTGIYNQDFFITRLGYSVEHTRELSGAVYGILFIDCDNFAIVEQQGEEFSNMVLAETARFLRKVVRPYDTISHFDTGQFFIQVEDLPTKQILHQIAERIYTNLTKHIHEFCGYEMTANIGMVYCSADYSSPSEIIRDADIALFYAKSNPLTNLVVFNAIKHGALRSPQKYAAIQRVFAPSEKSTDESQGS